MLTALFAFLTLALGAVEFSFWDLFYTLLNPGVKSPEALILWEFRFPRVIAAILAGASLSVSGLVLQTVFNNPLASPFLLGVNSGAGLGIALVCFLGGVFASFGIIPAATLGAFAVVSLILICSRYFENSLSLLILGLMIGYFIDSFVSLLIYFGDAESLRGYISWGFGSFSRLTLSEIPLFAGFVILGMLPVLFSIRYLNTARLGDSFAESLGIDLKKSRFAVLLGASILAAVTTVYCGPVSFIGVAVPHLTYGIFKSSNHRVLIPGCILCGALIALAAGLVPGIPLHAVTSLIGVPVVLWVLLRPQMKRWRKR
ncbi:MAG: iron ABC transporter permease [Fibrobacter sp.]|jgi:iron complex transport system permease protein|nr:iron ABC transporter permease [Fibrobacter sp.]